MAGSPECGRCPLLCLPLGNRLCRCRASSWLSALFLCVFVFCPLSFHISVFAVRFAFLAGASCLMPSLVHLFTLLTLLLAFVSRGSFVSHEALLSSGHAGSAGEICRQALFAVTSSCIDQVTLGLWLGYCLAKSQSQQEEIKLRAGPLSCVLPALCVFVGVII